ncbi:Stk1 family PASTA domain-containing Ser/Thr kinase [Acetanaerobacterium elongatum]|uniref:non-specific serine/threonine protein kinase n=1 Tax=Acetanaerobacterium elongatum TaxID=258515 RepID=A0A1G9VMP4_9FIRM|nr:Stk1 family PASTA domain-containing Ser/Thr kinase [Acetanaerobacterium elongatum]SDM73449.1 serine/threonine protein kinase [Acetanaerobacterium elongatum]
MDRYIGKRLDGRYEILELIGVGGMANVYRANDIVEHKEYAVKILRDEFLENEEFVRRFKNESKAIAVLSHPNIVKVYDVSFTDRIQFIVMEYVDGITLKEYIDQQHTLKWKECVHFTIQVLRALQHAHDRGIVHRDIKPQNIMLLPDGSIKVMDFGIARFARSETRTMTDKALGSVHYISPEQARGDVTDAKTDIYSVGVMMFEMLTGQLPFEADSPVSVAIKQISAQAKRPRELNVDIPEGLEEIVVRAMQKDASKRYHSAAEMLKDIDEFKKNPSIQFSYKYFTNESPTIYYDTKKVNTGVAARGADEHAAPARKPDRKGRRAAVAVAGEEEEDFKSPLMPIMTGVAFAFVITAVVFIVYIFILNNPFAKVEDIPMPKLVGLTFSDVTNNAEYQSHGFQYKVTYDYSSEYAEGIIYEQVPTEGRGVKPNTIVNLKVSKGIKKLKVPDIYNQEALAARARLNSEGITKIKEEQIFSDTYAEGRIVKTDPPKDTEISADTEVTLYISKGSETAPATVPPLVGMNINDAKRLLEAAGLKVGDITPIESSLAAGTIIAQDPLGDTESTKGSTVNFQIAAGSGVTIDSYNITVPLPTKINKMVTMRAYVDDGTVPKHEERVNPSETPQWKPTFSGSGTILIKITLDDKPYQEIQLDFTRGTQRVVTDNSKNF